MMNGIILNEEFEFILVKEAEKCEYIKDLELYNNLNYEKITKQKIQNLYQMVLLYDNIILPHNIYQGNFDKLENTGYFDIKSIEDMTKAISTTGKVFDIDIDFYESQIYKSAVIENLAPSIAGRYKTVEKIDDYTFSSLIYDLACSQETKLFNNLMKKYKDIVTFDNYALVYIEDIMDHIIKIGLSFLIWIMQLSEQYNATVLSGGYYDIEKIGVDWIDCHFNTKELIYNTIKIELSNHIEYMPEFNSLDDVFDLKEKKRKDIIRLKNIISELEYVLINHGKENMLKKISLDINKASKELTGISINLAKVATLATLFSIPVWVAEHLITKLPPIISMSGNAIGTYTILKKTYLKRHGGWTGVVR